MDPLALLQVVFALIAAGMIGANNAGNASATVAGARVVSYERGLTLFALGVVAGAVFEGPKLSGAIEGRGLEGTLGAWSVGVILGVTIGMIIIATAMGFPLPVTQALYGAAMGSGIFLGIPLNVPNIALVVISWGTTPIIAAGAAILISRIEGRLTSNSTLTLTTAYGILTLCASVYTAYVFGANTLGLIAGIVRTDLGWGSSVWLVAASASVGGVAFGGRVSRTLGEDLSSMGPQTAFAAQMGGALTVHLFTQLGIPVSISHAIVGGVTGGALSKGVKALNISAGFRIAVLWTATPLLTMVLAWLIHASAIS